MTITDPHARANLALSLLQQREHTEHTIDLAVMALRGADLEQLIQADKPQEVTS